MKLRISRPLSRLATLMLTSCAGDRAHVIRVSVADQRMALYEHGVEVRRFPISTSKFGLGDIPGSNRTPLGTMEIAKKIGASAPVGMKFKSRVPTGEIVPVNAPGRDPIVTRILWLRGLEARNANAFSRMIYIHGTPEERTLGSPSSYGCIRMRSRDIVQLFDAVGPGAKVLVDTAPLPAITQSSHMVQGAQGAQTSIPAQASLSR
jgi:lipoprotein-anchoring transpeptidase ErfK/SrfK